MRRGIIIVTFLNALLADAGIIVTKIATDAPAIDEDFFSLSHADGDISSEQKANYDDNDSQYDIEIGKKAIDKIKKPCAIVVLSNIQNQNVQSLLRKYRYDANGILIPGSVKYFIKMPQGLKSSPILVPLNDKAFSPLGGFVRYYKEVPPIPQAW